jgi:hypothetical protein
MEKKILKGLCLLCSGNEIKYLFIAEQMICKNSIHRKNELEAELID